MPKTLYVATILTNIIPKNADGGQEDLEIGSEEGKGCLENVCGAGVDDVVVVLD